MRKNYLVQAWLVIALAAGFGAALASVQVRLQPIIEDNKTAETYDKIPELVAGPRGKPADKGKTQEFVLPGGRIASQAFSADGEHAGWVLRATGDGFQDRIELLIGLSPDAGRITGLDVLDQKETPGLGSRIKDPPAFRQQFAGKPTDKPLSVKAKDPTETKIVPISGATVSSESVSDIVNQAVREFKGCLGDPNRLRAKPKG
jgi:electron transport complex protein RnfG